MFLAHLASLFSIVLSPFCRRFDLDLADGCSLIFSNVDSALDIMEGYKGKVEELLPDAGGEDFKSESELRAYVSEISGKLETEVRRRPNRISTSLRSSLTQLIADIGRGRSAGCHRSKCQDSRGRKVW